MQYKILNTSGSINNYGYTHISAREDLEFMDVEIDISYNSGLNYTAYFLNKDPFLNNDPFISNGSLNSTNYRIYVCKSYSNFDFDHPGENYTDLKFLKSVTITDHRIIDTYFILWQRELKKWEIRDYKIKNIIENG